MPSIPLGSSPWLRVRVPIGPSRVPLLRVGAVSRPELRLCTQVDCHGSSSGRRRVRYSALWRATSRSADLAAGRGSLRFAELSDLSRQGAACLERLNCRGHAAGAWASAAADCLSRSRPRCSSRLTSRNLGEPGNARPFTLLLGSTSCGHRPVRRASPVSTNKSTAYAISFRPIA